MAVKVSKRDLVWSYLAYGINIGINIIILPLILKFLTGEEVGLWYSFISIGIIAVLLDFGFAPTIARNVTYCWSGVKILNKSGISDFSNKDKPNFELLSKIINTCKFIYLIISILALLLLLTGGTIYIIYIARDIKGIMHIIAWFIYCFAIFFNLYFGYYTSLLRGVGAIYEGHKANVIARLFQIVISVFGLISGLGIIAVSLAYLLSSFVLRFNWKKYFYRYENIGYELKKYYKRINIQDFLDTFKAVWHNAWRDGIVSLAKFLIMQSNTILCSIYLGLEVTASYGLSLQLLTVIGSISSLVFGTYQSMISNSHLLNDTSKLKRIFSVSMFSYYITYWIGVICLFFVGLPLLNLVETGTKIQVIVLLFMSIYIFLEYNHSLFASYISTKNRVPYTGAFLLSGIAIVTSSFILLNTTKLGIWALLISQFVVQLLYNNWKWPLVVIRELQITIREMISIGYNEVKRKLKF